MISPPLEHDNRQRISEALSALEEVLRRALSEGDINAVSVRVTSNRRKLGRVRVLVERELH